MAWTKEEQVAHRQELYKALRSGEYTQTQSALRTDKGFCCLGVACDKSGLGVWRDSVNEDHVIFVPIGGSGSIQILPDIVMWYYGFSTNTGFILKAKDLNPDSIGEHLASLNDAGFTFDQIADVIEYYFWEEDHEATV